jgi:hypothetical protein
MEGNSGISALSLQQVFELRMICFLCMQSGLWKIIMLLSIDSEDLEYPRLRGVI